MKKENPGKQFIPAYREAVCPNMKINTLEKIYKALKEEKNIVTVPDSIAEKARKALQRMFELKK